MLDRARRRVKRARLPHVHLVRGDIRFAALCRRRSRTSRTVIAPYGILQSLLRESDLTATLAAVRKVLKPGGTFGLELVADLPSWEEYRKRVSLRGWRRRAGRRPRHARRNRAPGSRQAADDLRSGVHRAPGRDRARAPVSR